MHQHMRRFVRSAVGLRRFMTLLLGDCWTGVMCARARLPAVSLLTFRVFRLFRPRRLIRRFAFIVIRVFRLFRHLLVKAEPEPNGT